MNERIKELAEQAFESAHTENGSFPIMLQRFAELIVKECFKAAMIESKGHMNPIDLMQRMKEQVGVDERTN